MPNFYRNNYYVPQKNSKIFYQNPRITQAPQPFQTNRQKPPPPPCKPSQKKKVPPSKKISLKSLKKDTCTSLNDVECFLNKFSDFIKYIKIIYLLK